ncbi:amino acid ABC transporter permease [Microtetraspora glauca]|uniref:Amino acid ABC transporter permease n=1 Tax=Microtetraspora glauca TaxID=1996 RepID=A0ABV3GI30_MICGL
MIPLDVLGNAIVMTVVITVSSFLIGAILGVPLVLLRTSRFGVVRVLTRALIDVLRGVPPVVWIFILYFGVSSDVIKLDPLTAAIGGLGVISCAYLAEIYRGGLLSVHAGQTEAAQALGFGQVGIFTRIVAPQAFRVCLPSAATYGIGLLKDSSLASTIGVAEIAFRATAQARSGGDGITPFVIAGVLYIALSMPLAYLSRTLDTKLRMKVSV